MPQDLGQYIGQPAFEQARGVVMEICGFTAAEALAALISFTHQTGIDIEETVSALRISPKIYGPIVCG